MRISSHQLQRGGVRFEVRRGLVGTPLGFAPHDALAPGFLPAFGTLGEGTRPRGGPESDVGELFLTIS